MRENDLGNSYYRKRRQKRGSVIPWIQLLLTIAVLAVLYMTDMMPLQYLIVGAAVLFILFFITFGMCHSLRSRSGGRIFSILICLVLGVLLLYLGKTYSVLDRITGSDTRIDEMSVIVLKDDPAESLEDASGYIFGTAQIDSENAGKVTDEINNKLKTEISSVSFSAYAEEVGALYDGQVGAIIFNEAYREMMIESYPEFSNETRVIYTMKIKTKVDIGKSDKKVTQEPFYVYITGIDTYGDISTTSRSDVNIIAKVDPKNRKIQMVSTPRDAYVELPSFGAYDKLTHAGIYGVQESIGALEALYGIKIDYYLRVNFSGFEKIVDALGGITVESDYAFTSWDGEYFEEGINELSGSRALSFARERKSFGDGDFQRGRNQMKVIRAILDKAMSPSILGSYTRVLDSLTGSFDTSMSSAEISSLVKMQLSNGGSWDIESYEVTGYGDYRATYSYGSAALDVVVLDEAMVEEARALLQ